jgi:quercetin dioxygenase-like cupin family protein
MICPGFLESKTKKTIDLPNKTTITRKQTTEGNSKLVSRGRLGLKESTTATKMTTNELPLPKRHITTNDKDGTSAFASEISSSPPSRTLPDGLKITFCYGNARFPIDVNQHKDLESYQHLIDNPPGIVLQNGVVFRIIDFPPGYVSAMHRTISVNFNVVIEGQLELILDGGERRTLSRGDSAIQRAVNHSWRNTSTVEWARLAAVPIPAEPLQFTGVNVEASGVAGMSASS